MDMIVRAVTVYGVVWAVFRLSGRRTMSEMTTFDFVLLLICGEAIQQALLGEDVSMTNAVVVVLTLVGADRALTWARTKWPGAERVMEGLPLVIMADGRPLRECMDREHVDEQDILHAARESHGLSRLDQVKHAVLETSGKISIIPRTEPQSSQP
jgi:uncharacterized membrane protein YcaP (DUF421 family)